MLLEWEGLSDCRTRNFESPLLFLVGMGEGGASVSGPVGVHPQRSVLFAQVSDSDPRMAFDEGGTMHQFGTKGSFGKVYLGDVSGLSLIHIPSPRDS